MRLQLDSSINRSGDAGQTAAANGFASASRNGSAAGSGSPDSIQISGASSALNLMASDRAAKIAQLTSAVQSGTYQVPSSQISQAIVEQGFS